MRSSSSIPFHEVKESAAAFDFADGVFKIQHGLVAKVWRYLIEVEFEFKPVILA